MNNPKSIRALFAMPGFTAASKLVGVFGDRYARVIKLKRRKKQLSVVSVGTDAEGVTTRRFCEYATSQWPDGDSTWSLNAGASVARGAAPCM
jgi:hypothetical protein